MSRSAHTAIQHEVRGGMILMGRLLTALLLSLVCVW